ncbi:MAG: DUF2250 domain-containing protein [Candidatus Zixiibacteriota bacterium]
MSDLGLKEGYKIARCCSPHPDDTIKGYYSYNHVLVVHQASCDNLKKIEPERLFSLSWEEILEKKEDEPEKDYYELDELDFRILRHHQAVGVDYAWVVAGALNIEPEQVFERHKKLKELKLLKRVEPVMIQYRKGIVDNKWIKHRNHTYYQITPKGERYLRFFVSKKECNS